MATGNKKKKINTNKKILNEITKEYTERIEGNIELFNTRKRKKNKKKNLNCTTIAHERKNQRIYSIA